MRSGLQAPATLPHAERRRHCPPGERAGAALGARRGRARPDCSVSLQRICAEHPIRWQCRYATALLQNPAIRAQMVVYGAMEAAIRAQMVVSWPIDTANRAQMVACRGS